MKTYRRYQPEAPKHRVWILIVVLAVVLLANLIHQGIASAADHRGEQITMTSPAWMPPLIRRLAICESRGNPRHQVHRASDGWTGGGIVSWAATTWAADKYPGMATYPWQAPLEDQVRVAIRSVRRHRAFGCLRLAWVRG